MFQRSPGCRLLSGSAPRVRAKGHGRQRPGPRSGRCRWSEEGLRMVLPALAGCDRRGPALRRGDDPAATRRGTRPLTGTRPCQTAAKLRCCAGRRSGSRQHEPIAFPDPTLATPRHSQTALTNLGSRHTPMQAGCPVPWLPRFNCCLARPPLAWPIALTRLRWYACFERWIVHTGLCNSTAPWFVVSALLAGSGNPAAVPRSCDRAR